RACRGGGDPHPHLPRGRHMSDRNTIQSQLLDTAGFVGTARTLLGEGKSVDLDSLEPRVATVCDDIAKLPPAERSDLKTALLALRDGLGGLADDVRSQQPALARELQSVGVRRHATAAYGALPPKAAK